MTYNDGVVTDPKDGQAESWFELFNPGTQSLNLTGWYLSGDPANRFQSVIPAGFQLAPGGFLLVWADGEPAQNTPFNGDLHVNFQLANSSILGLYAPDGTQMDLVDLVKGVPGCSYGSRLDGNSLLLETVQPTPRAANGVIRIKSIAMNSAATGPQLALTGLPLASHRVQGTTNLAAGGWTDVATRMANPLGDFVVTDEAGSNAPARFYRAVSP